MTLSTPSTPARPRLTLKVSTPASASLSVSSSPHPPSSPSPLASPASPAPSISYRPWLISGTIALGLLGIGVIPIPSEVGGTVTLKAKPGNLRTISTPIAGVIDSLSPVVQAGSRLKKGQAIAQIRSRDVEREIAQMQQALAEANQQLEEQQRRQVRAATEVQTAIAQSTALQQQSKLANHLAQAMAPSPMQEIAANVHKQQVLLASAEAKLQRYDSLVQEGALPRQKWEEVRDERNRIAGEMEVSQRSLATTQQKLTQDADSVQIQIGRQETIIAAQRDAAQAEQQTQAIHERIANLKQRLQQLEGDRRSLTLRAPIDGVVISEGFDLKVGKELKPDQDLLEIVNLREGLVGSVEIDEQDIKSVQAGKSVRFRLSNDKLRGFDAKVERVIPNVKTDQTGQKRTLSVLISVKNQDEQLQNGSSGYAYIHSEQIPVYQRVRQEILRLFSWERL